MPTTTCPSCHNQLKTPENLIGKKVQCPHCQIAFTVPEDNLVLDPEPVYALPLPTNEPVGSKRITAAICGILLGAFGIHKFILGLTTPGVVMLLITICTCGLGYPVMHIIGIIEGVIYLTKSDQEFYELYMVEKKGWF